MAVTGKWAMRRFAGRILIGGAVMATAALVTSTTSAVGAPRTAARESAPTSAARLTRADIPWSQVGPGWYAAVVSATDLVMVSPQGTSYAVADVAKGSSLDSWSAARRTVIVSTPGASGHGNEISEIDLVSGAVLHQFTPSPTDQTNVTYLAPEDTQLVVTTFASSSIDIETTDLAGQLVRTLPSDFGNGDLYAGTFAQVSKQQLALSTSAGVAVVGTNGSTIATIAGPAGEFDCIVSRMWSKGVALASCLEVSSGTRTQLWRIPVDGAAPTALTNVSAAGVDFFEAWSTSSGTFVSKLQGSGLEVLAKLGANGTTSAVTVPGAPSTDSSHVLGVSGRLIGLYTTTSTGGPGSLVTYDPSTLTSTVLLDASHGGPVSSALGYGQRDGQFT